MNLSVPLQDGSEVTPVFSDGDDDNFPGQQLERLCVDLVMQDLGGRSRLEVGTEVRTGGMQQAEHHRHASEKEHPAAVPPAVSIPHASWVRMGSGLQGRKGTDI